MQNRSPLVPAAAALAGFPRQPQSPSLTSKTSSHRHGMGHGPTPAWCCTRWAAQEVGWGHEAPGQALSWQGAAPCVPTETCSGLYFLLQTQAGLRVPRLLHGLDKKKQENTRIPSHVQSPSHSGNGNGDKPTPLPASARHNSSPFLTARKKGYPPLRNCL